MESRSCLNSWSKDKTDVLLVCCSPAPNIFFNQTIPCWAYWCYWCTRTDFRTISFWRFYWFDNLSLEMCGEIGPKGQMPPGSTQTAEPEGGHCRPERFDNWISFGSRFKPSVGVSSCGDLWLAESLPRDSGPAQAAKTAPKAPWTWWSRVEPFMWSPLCSAVIWCEIVLTELKIFLIFQLLYLHLLFKRYRTH